LIPRTVLILALVSFLNDSASDMIAPLLPLFLTATLGAGPAVVGLVEGVAEATASLLKLLSGRLVDRGWSHKGLVVGGYGASNLARPLIGLALGWGWVLLLRFLDRVGKGIRTSPRDALIAASTSERQRGTAFGFHRALDNAGAMVGPLVAFALLSRGFDMGHVFLWSIVPGALVLLLLTQGLDDESGRPRPGVQTSLRWGHLDHRVRGMILAAGGLALASAPEAFLVLWASDRGLTLAWVPLIWAAANAVKALVAAPAGTVSDRFGRRPVLIVGWSLRILLFLLLALGAGGKNDLVTWLLFLGYAAALATTEGAERALIGDFTPGHERGTAFGLYHMSVGLAALPGAIIFGSVWQLWGSPAAFLLSALIATSAVAALLTFGRARAQDKLRSGGTPREDLTER
jgi:MFS family permease